MPTRPSPRIPGLDTPGVQAAVIPPVALDGLPVPESVALVELAGVRVWPWWGPRTSSFDPSVKGAGLRWESAPMRLPRPSKRGDRREAFFGVYGRSQGKVRVVPSPNTMLDEFMKLAEAPPAAVVAFARKYGVLGICKHGRPCSHTPFTSTHTSSDPERCTPLQWTGHGGVEPVAAWLAYSRLAATILRADYKLRVDRTLDADDWSVLLGARSRGPYPPRRAAKIARLALVAAVNRWLVDGDLRPWVTLDPTSRSPRSRIRLASPWWLTSPSWPLFGALGMALAQTIVRARLAWCDGCGARYQPKRLRPDENHYCLDCGREAAVRAAKARYREKRKRAATSPRR